MKLGKKMLNNTHFFLILLPGSRRLSYPCGHFQLLASLRQLGSVLQCSEYVYSLSLAFGGATLNFFSCNKINLQQFLLLRYVISLPLV